MRGQEEDAGTQLRAAGWRQGSVVQGEILSTLGFSECDLAVVVSQDCDVVQSVDVEPDVELILGRRRDAPRPDCRFGRNPRELDLEIVGRTGAVTFRIRERVMASKEHLAAHRPAPVALVPRDMALLAKWIARRYTRPAWPDAFNERLRAVDDRLERLFKSGAGVPITSILLRLEPEDDELAEGEPYRLAAWLTVSADSLMNDAASKCAYEFERRFKEILGSCDGIVLEEEGTEVRSEDDVTMADLRELRRFDRDYRSAAPKPGGQLPPNEM